MQIGNIKIPKLSKKIAIIAGASIIVGSVAVYFLLVFKKPVDPEAPPPVPKQVTSLVESMSKKIDIPQSEPPTVATVDDPKKLQDQVFFAKAKKGDKILMFIDAQKAYIYRPSTDAIIESGPIEIVEEEETASESAVLAASSSAKTGEPPVLRIKF